MECPKKMVELMHDYLDGEIRKEDEQLLRKHIHECKKCSDHFYRLKKTVSFIENLSHIAPSSDFTKKVMANLPKEKRRIRWQRWFTNHPFITAASLFLLLITSSLWATWHENEQFSFSKQENLIVKNNTVIVPKGKVVEGDIIVRNGNIKIEGEVHGDVTVINGKKYLASAGEVTGEIEEVNEVFDWIWYNIKRVGQNITEILVK
ncbi:anti-sigma factor RsiW [Thermolongibacillus altinsuensis]|uniref:Anti-sigma factor RsiW n=2 Tax=Thermolongibacillus altinsuensis TaxID=575256 RepID=A0A4R1Q750_9BACL|nr:anti-sigma factor [Thermolongibacillus altinsuensis]TCL43961.1 anti-sigma factor RsiW [Thermolongibacillus altinsuensis]GMB09968.1 anti-sigma-W factor RsiW [Thermolongibacillus altinsuensis]